MSRDYSLNADSAKKAEQINNRITETGKYAGTLVSAEAVTSMKGTEGIEFTFKAESGASADFLTVWTHNKDGKELRGLDVINAMMTCLQIRGIKAEAGTLEKWDSSANARVMKKTTIFPAFTNKKIGLLLQREEYEKGDGSVGAKMQIAVPFDVATNRTAGEILGKVAKGETIDRLALGLKDKLLKSHKASAPAGEPAPTSDDDFSDSIPF